MRTRIKICGIKDEHTALIAAECGADAIGLVFASGSPRTVDVDTAFEIVSVLPPFVTSVGLFVNPTPEQYGHALMETDFDLGQFHGQENERLVRECGPRLIKAVRYRADSIESELNRWNAVAEIDAVLIDGGPGGTGQQADWSHLAQVRDQCDHPLILAGGLTPANVAEAIRLVRPFAVDVSSGVESEPGVKDPALIKAFCEAVRRADDELARAED